MKYYDKNREEIKAGMHLRMADGTVEKIYACDMGDGEIGLGINASNEEYLLNKGLDVEINRACYPLHQFDLTKAEICQPELDMAPTTNQAM